MEYNAWAYDELSKPQIEAGCKFINELNLSVGNKVLDMGCGTGNITKYVADIVGSDGQVVGIDPDVARIKIAKEKYKEVNNLQFHVGSSVTGFPHDNEPYYDVHISTAAFHWVPNEEKPIYIQKAYESLKPGGRLAISCPELVPNVHVKISDRYPLTQDGYCKIIQDVGLFTNVVTNRIIHPYRFKTFEELKQWFKASTHHDFNELDGEELEFIIKDDDGSGIYKMPRIAITASKIE